MTNKETMKAVAYEKYGAPEVLHIKEIQRPFPEANELLIKIHATTVTKYDCWMRSSTAPPGFKIISRIASGIRKPKIPILGLDFAGVVEKVGKDIKQFKKGDQVFGFSPEKMSTYAEYISLPEKYVSIKPTNMTFSEAVTIPYGGLTALYFLSKANIQKNQNVLIFGASGGVGLQAVQFAKYLGANVTGVCSTSKIELVKSMGADTVIDYTKEDFTKRNNNFDVIFDTIGKSPFSGSRKSLKKEGYYIFATFGLLRLLRMLWLKLTSRIKVVIGNTNLKGESLTYLKGLIESNNLKSVIDKKFQMEQIAEAHEYVEEGQKKGYVVIEIVKDE